MSSKIKLRNVFNSSLLTNISLALSAVWSQKLRSSLTLLSISIGVFAIIAAGSASSSLDNSFKTELAALGQNTFMIKRTPGLFARQSNRSKYRNRKTITYRQARNLKRRMDFAKSVSISDDSRSTYRVKSGNRTTNPNVRLTGADFDYFTSTNLDVDLGRSVSDEDVAFNRPVAVLGSDVAKALFPYSSPIGREIRINAKKFSVVGLLKSKGTSAGQSLDNVVVIPISFYMNNFVNAYNESVNIYVTAYNFELLEETIDEATGLMRIIRNVQPGDENDFVIETNESLTKQFSDLLVYISGFASISGLIALITAGIGIMNMMLVTVRERTREIGIRKALGANRIKIMGQFLVEAITLCQLGGIIGVIMGLTGSASLFSLLDEGVSITIIVPWLWVGVSVAFCTLIGLVFGLYPALKASRLDPIEALRYE